MRRAIRIDIDLRERRNVELTLETGNGVVFTIQPSPLGYPIVPITRLSAHLNAGVRSGDLISCARGRVFLRLAAHLNISLLRKAHWSTSQVHFYGFAFFACGKRTSEGAPLEGSWFPILSWVPPSLLLCPLHFDETFWTMQCARSTRQRVHGNIVGLRKNLVLCTRTSWRDRGRRSLARIDCRPAALV